MAMQYAPAPQSVCSEVDDYASRFAVRHMAMVCTCGHPVMSVASEAGAEQIICALGNSQHEYVQVPFQNEIAYRLFKGPDRT